MMKYRGTKIRTRTYGGVLFSTDLHAGPMCGESTSRVRKQRRAGGCFGYGIKRDDEETLGAVRFRNRQRPEEAFDCRFLLIHATRGDDFRRTASGFSSSHEFRRRGPDHEGVPFAGFDLLRCRWDDRSEAVGDTYRRRMEAPDFDELHLPVSKFRHVEAGWGRNDVRRVAEDADDYHGHTAWPQEQTLGDFRQREQQRPDGGLAAAWEFHGRRAAEGFSTAGDHDWRQNVTDFADSEGREARRGQPGAATGSLGDVRRGSENKTGYEGDQFFGFHSRSMVQLHSEENEGGDTRKNFGEIVRSFWYRGVGDERREADFSFPLLGLRRDDPIIFSGPRGGMHLNPDYWACEVAVEIGLVRAAAFCSISHGYGVKKLDDYLTRKLSISRIHQVLLLPDACQRSLCTKFNFKKASMRQLYSLRGHYINSFKQRAEHCGSNNIEENKEESISRVALMWRAIKLPIYSVALIPITVGSAAAYLQTGQFFGKRYLKLLLSSVLIITWLNLSNDVYDFETGADKNKKESVVNLIGSQTGTHILAWVLLELGFGGLTWVSIEAGSIRSIILLACAIFCGYIYQCPPFRLSYLGLGEPLCFAAFGPFATTAFCLLQSGTSELSISATVISSSILVGFTTTLILFCSHFHQIEDDKAVGKFSPVVRLGTEGGANVVKVAVRILYSLLFVLGLAQILPFPSIVLCALTLPVGNLVVSFVGTNHKVQ
ncbi:1-4-dihydroxy-2-naphthoate polyprenyltransferase-chloroplastic [Striga hermonthica]|uniref:1-4-dihydroxy-2-naphthoate polyprenyltransferase-chloroplastic n=1 Tax=Striga hermonthica TaxID=68872 RepID=A0A9N7MIG6_STRHE|nr:1-4-dihydroxy-2-naphthoate polyprenyltransferase-chloroplastic [Striga hermonthica]